MFASNPHQVFRQLSNNENVPSIKHGDLKPSATSNSMMTTTSKTPATSNKNRRALGDISNRKRSGLNGSAAPKKNVGLRLQQQPQQQQQQRNPFATKTPGLSKRKEVSFLPRASQTKPAPSLNILPDFGNINKTPKSRQLPKSATKSITKISAISDIVEEIEQPAGRLWMDEPDDSSYGSASLPGASTFRKDFIATCRQGNALRLQSKKEQEELEEIAFDQYVEDVFANDEEEIIGADVWIQRTQSFYGDLDLDAELSFDAPSYCGDISF